MMNEVLLKFRINQAVVSYKLYTQLASLVKLFIMDGFTELRYIIRSKYDLSNLRCTTEQVIGRWLL